ncbi:uncharacterized protein BYT42DRAFT_645619 [Radiomyces spectabilis]|uniref:uncharacterized protein n=1 Tax=Radiomyces spectabilis TaxID=64574 RepID=UPI00221F047D|nr:uncharacterized protein BYT42DRAFT_645619 [Radiomyces spectabilis]KAI8375941.1 hypothetical protein BYT42DRAFT_645619 [Radiomyces spectabilis]
MVNSSHEHQPLPTNIAQDEYYQNARDRSVEEGSLEEYMEKPAAPPRRRFYKKKKYWIICSVISAIVIVVVVCLIVFVFFPMIAQSLMNGANISVEEAQITFNPPQGQSNALQLIKRQDQPFDPQSTFYMSMKSKMSNTGPFSADIKFHNPIQVYYNDTQIGTITLPDSKISGGSGELNAVTPFLISNTSFFAAFSRDMLAFESFKWKMKGQLDITALSRTATVNLDKDIKLDGMNGFPDVSIDSFKLPADDPNGGIKVELGTVLKSPSPIGVQLGTIKLAVGYEGVHLGDVASDNVSLKKGDNKILLKGTLVPQNDTNALDKVSTLFSNYVSGKVSNTTATGISAAPNGKDPIGWLSEGFKSVQLNVALSAAAPLNIIHAVSMGYLDLQFNKDTPYAPIASAPNVVADFSIPFGFSLNITEVSQNITLGTNSTGNFSVIQVPFVPAKSDQQAGKLQFAMENDAITALPDKEAAFNDYTFSLTASDLYSFQVGGNATTKTQTPLGPITLSGITFEVPTSLHGLKFLNSTPTVINSLDVSGGTKDAMQLAINVTMENPSDFSIGTGDVHLAMLSKDTHLGDVLLSNLKLNRGSNTVIASASFDPKSSSVGQELLSSFVMGKNNDVQIKGHESSTEVLSLAAALGNVSIGSTLPGLKAPLVQGSALTVLPNTIQTSVVNVAVTIANPFSAGLSITKVRAAASFQGMPVGNIDQDISGNAFNIGGHATANSQPLDMKMNLEPTAVALLLRQLAVQEKLDTRALDGLLGMGGFHIEGQQDVKPTADIFQGFNISSYVMDAMKALKVDLQLESGLTIGEYTNTLRFSQNQVQVTTDGTVTGLIPIVGQPIVQQIVDGAQLAFETIVLSAPTNENFKVQMTGSITKTGPMDAAISFPQPLTVAWQGKELGKVTMPTIQAKADAGAQFNVSGDFTISNQNDMAEFSTYLIGNKDFVWDIRTDTVSVNALGFEFKNIKMEKFVTLAGANGFKDAVKINSFDLPANDPEGGIQLIAKTSINNPSQVGFDLDGVGFQSIFKDVTLGPLASNGRAVFPPKGTANIEMKGRLVKQTSEEGLAAVTEVFENYLSANNSVLTVAGESGSGPNGQVGWLSQAFKTLKIENVVLPGPKEKPTLIPSITLKDMEMDFTKDAYAPPSGSKQVEAQLKNPFGFPLGVSQLNMDVNANQDHHDIASMKVPDEKATTNNAGLVTTQFSNVPFSVKDDAHSLFNDFVKALTSSQNVTFGLAGTSNAIADTAVGALKLNNIGFDVQTSLAGFNNFDGKNNILSLKVVGGTSEYVKVQLRVAFNNPSQITITVGDLSFAVMMNEQNANVGKVIMKDVVIKPGMNEFDAEMQLGGSDQKAVSQMLGDYLTNAKVPLTIQGNEQSSQIASLQSGLSTVHLATTMQGIQSNLVKSVKVSARAIDILGKKATAYVTLNNPLDTEYAISKVKVDVTYPNGGQPYKVGHIDYELPSPITVPAGGTATTDGWPVSIDANIFQLFDLLGESDKSMNLQQNVSVIVGGSYKSEMYYYQDKVATELDVSFLGIHIPSKSKDDGSSDAAASSSPASSASSSETPSKSSSSSSSSSSTSSPTASKEAESAKPSEKSSESDSKDSSSGDSKAKSSDSSDSDDGKPHFVWPFKI